MKKKFLYIFFVFFFCFIFINPVYADPENEENCGSIEKLITEYDYYQDTIKELDCNDTSNEESVIICNDSKMKINIAVSEIMKYNDRFKICDSQKADVERIIDENKDRCSQIFDDDFNDFVNGIMILFYIVAPILLILFGSLDYAKAVVASEAEALKKANQRFLKRLAATVLIFLAPVITNLIISFNVSDYYLSGNSYACDFNYTIFNKKWNIKYVPKQPTSTTTTSSTASGGNKVGNYVLFGQSDPSWSSDPLIASSGTTIRQAGCAVTSVAMAIVNSGVETTEPINPGSLSRILKNTGNYGCKCGCCIVWSGSSAATNGHLVYQGKVNLTGNINNKAQQLADYLNQGYHIVIQVKWGTDDSSHFVYVLYVDNGNIMYGESWDGTLRNLNQQTQYPIATSSYSSAAILYKVVN